MPKHTIQIYDNIRNSHKNEGYDENDAFYENDFVRVIRKKLPLEHKQTEKWARERIQIAKVIEKTLFDCIN